MTVTSDHKQHLCADCLDCVRCSRSVCKLGRTRRRPVPPGLPEVRDFDSVAGLVAELRAHAARIAHFASMAMTEGRGSESLIRDMHDVIGDVGCLQSVANLLEHRFGELRQK
jgi:hypothetical protein